MTVDSAPPAVPPDPAGDAPRGDRGRLAAAVATAVDATGGLRRSPGTGVEIATQHAGGKTVGVALRDDRVEVHVIAESLPLPPLLERVQAGVARTLLALGDHRRVDVVIDDLDVEVLPGGPAR